MTEVLQVYRCMVCGNVVEVMHSGRGQLVCCGQPMRLIPIKRDGEGKEKHLPVIKVDDSTVTVTIGNIPHPMEENHYIEWIEVSTDDSVFRRTLKPGYKPKAEFHIGGTSDEKVTIRVYCNIHGLWGLEMRI